MRLKSFYANTITEAMKMVRDTLGEDAVIVATREEKEGGVRLTAAIEPPDRYQDDQYHQDRNFNAGQQEQNDETMFEHDDINDENTVTERLTDVMLRHNVPEDVIDQIISCATVVGLEQPEVALIAALEHLYSFRPLTRDPNPTATMLVGPPGSGKTLIVAKLAARAVMNDQTVSVISSDTVRAGGIEQLSAFTRLMDVDLEKASSQKQLMTALENARDSDHIIIDTAGVNPFNPEDMRVLARLIAAGEIEPVLALPAGTDAEESGEIGRAFAALGVKSLIATRLDIARRIGGVFAAAHYGGLIFADASNTPKVADGLFALSPQRLAHILMPELARTKKQTKTAPKKETVYAG